MEFNAGVHMEQEMLVAMRVHTGLYALYVPAPARIWDIQGSDFIEYKKLGWTQPERRKGLC